MEILNKKARFDYYIEEEYEAGIVLVGTEIKSIRDGKANIKDSYGIIKNGEAFILNMFISQYEEGNIFNHEENRTRKLLLNKREINKIKDKLEIEGYSFIPLKVYFKNNKAKLLIGIAKGKKNYDKREDLKKKDQLMEIKKMAKYN